MSTVYQMLLSSPVGPLTLSASETALTGIDFGDTRHEPVNGASPVLAQAAEELTEYFEGRRRSFTVPLAPEGTAFQKEVWAALREIPYGGTASYGAIAARIGRPGAAIAVGQANRRNPIPIIIPCHRVIGTDGQLVGYAGGLEIKRSLLDREQ